MTKVTKFDKVLANKLSQEMKTLLNAFALEHGLTIRNAGGRFDDTKFTVKLELSVNDPAAAEKKNTDDYNRYCSMFGLLPVHLGTVFSANGKRYKLVGLNVSNRSKKYPIRVLDIAAQKEILFGEMVSSRIVQAYQPVVG